jgi:CubicO group peptidase (beta-lactamase class C family)
MIKRFVFIILTFICCRLNGGEFTDISADMGALMEGTSVPSLAAAVVVKGRITAMGASGLRKQGAPERVCLTDKYHIGSCTKSMTAVLAARLVDEGLIAWETTCAQVFRHMTIHPGYRDATLHQFLTNTGGTPRDLDEVLWHSLWQAQGTPTEQRLQLVTAMVSSAPAYPPGSRYEYSNAGFAIAGAMLEQVAGASYEDLLVCRLFRPLGMLSAGFRAPAVNGVVTQPYGHVSEEGVITAVDPEPAGDNPAAIAPAGGVHCSVEDLARYAQFHLGIIGKELLTEGSRSMLYRVSSRHHYAMGWVVEERSWAHGKALTHAGSNRMFYTVLWIAPERDFAAMAMCNSGHQDAHEVCDRVIGHLIRSYLP